MDSFLLSILTCPRRCSSSLQIAEIGHSPDISSQEFLECPTCHSLYPVVSGVPVLFPDENRTKFAVNNNLQAVALQEIAMNYQHQVGKFALSGEHRTEEAMAWEYFLRPSWTTNIGKGHKSFSESVMVREPSLTGKVMLNVGCGADPLLELFKEAGVRVIEQDIVLDGPLHLAAKGALGICSDLRHLPIKTGIIDIVTAYLTIHHVWPIEQPIAEMCRVLKSGGSLFVRGANDLALTSRIRRNLPPILQRLVLKLLTRSGYKESPYEKFINPFHLVDCLKGVSEFSTIELSFTKNPSSKVKGASITSFLVQIIPSLSSSFDLYARKGDR